MPVLKKIENFGKWGDMISFGGKIYSLDSTGYFQQAYGPESNPDPGLSGENDDGQKSSCALLALKTLGIDISSIEKFRNEVDDEGPTPFKLSNELLKSAGYELHEFVGLVGDFILQHPTGRFYLTSTDYRNKHAIAVIDGNAFNLKFSTLKNQVFRVWVDQRNAPKEAL